MSVFCSGVGWSEFKEWSRTLPGSGQGTGGRTTFDLLQSCRIGEWVILPQCTKDHRSGTGFAQDLISSWRSWKIKRERGDGTKTLRETSLKKPCYGTERCTNFTSSVVSSDKHYFVFPAWEPDISWKWKQIWMYRPNYRPPITQQVFLLLLLWLETQPCLTYEFVQNDKLFILSLSFAKVEPVVIYSDCKYYSCFLYSYHIYLYREKPLYFCKRNKTIYK